MNTTAAQAGASGSSWKRAKHRLTHSIKLRMVLVFLLLAGAMTLVFITGAQRAFSVGWREAARPLLMDYVDHLTQDLTLPDGAPSIERARAITERLPLTVRIIGPKINWVSHPDQELSDTHTYDRNHRWKSEDWGGGKDRSHIFSRSTADGHSVEFGINGQAFERKPRLVGYALAALLVLTLLAWLYVSRLLKPLDAIGAGARRFGLGDFSEPISERCCQARGELGELATTINTMGSDIHQMLEAKRGLLLAISHELRSPLTRARLNTELLPDSADVQPQREALLRDLREMTRLITDLLESERLAGHHTALQREAVDLGALAAEVVAEVLARQPERPGERLEVSLHVDPVLPSLPLDATRIHLLLRNLLDNALRHSVGAAQPPELHIRTAEQGGIEIEVRDHGPGVPEDQIPHLAQAFYRPESARTRATGGVGLGLYLCKLVAQAHGGTFNVRNAKPGLVVTVGFQQLPLQ